MSSRVDEEQTTVNPGIGDEPITLSRELFSEVSRVLVFDLVTPSFRISVFRCLSDGCWRRKTTHVSDDGFPTAFVVDLIAVSRGIDNVQLQPDPPFDDDYHSKDSYQNVSTGRVSLSKEKRNIPCCSSLISVV
jgi:hypothetical protein